MKNSQSVRDHILSLARENNISSHPTAIDQMAIAITRCSGNESQMDDVILALVHLEQSGIINEKEAQNLLIDYVNEIYADS